MARSNYTKQVARLRNFLVIAYVILSAISLGLAFALAWYGKSGAPWFLGTTISLGLWAAVTATCNKVSAGDFLGVAKVFGVKGDVDQRAAA